MRVELAHTNKFVLLISRISVFTVSFERSTSRAEGSEVDVGFSFCSEDSGNILSKKNGLSNHFRNFSDFL